MSGFGLCGTAETIIAAMKENPSITDLTVVSNNAGDGVVGLGMFDLSRSSLSYIIAMLFFVHPSCQTLADLQHPLSNPNRFLK
jgi:acyl CoA:acetate/3-ketoacid CoA transferase alpha subunit